jgi:hypothetical protein
VHRYFLYCMHSLLLVCISVIRVSGELLTIFLQPRAKEGERGQNTELTTDGSPSYCAHGHHTPTERRPGPGRRRGGMGACPTVRTCVL